MLGYCIISEQIYKKGETDIVINDIFRFFETPYEFIYDLIKYDCYYALVEIIGDHTSNTHNPYEHATNSIKIINLFTFHELICHTGNCVFNTVDGSACYTFLNAKLHSYNDQPAVKNIYTREWRYHGLLHRANDKPSVEMINEKGDIEESQWYYYGLLHREINDQPAIIKYNHMKVWYKHGNHYRILHRPTIEYEDGICVWTDSNGNQLTSLDSTVFDH